MVDNFIKQFEKCKTDNALNENKLSNQFMNDCSYCKKSFTTRSNLLLHQKTAKYCLNLRGTHSDIFKCDYCEKTYATNQRLKNHVKKCLLEKKEKDKENSVIQLLKKQIETLEKKNNELQKTISAIALKGSNTTIVGSNNGNNCNNKKYTLNLNDKDAMTKFLEENLDKTVVGGGQKALANLISTKYLKAPDGKDLYVCTDPARQTFEFCNTEGYVEKDVKAYKLKKALIDGNVQEKAAEIGPQLWTKEDGSQDNEKQSFYILRVTEIMNIENDDQKFRGELVQLKS